MKIASYGPHFGEEPEIVGYAASGTIFLSGCNLLCAFCQNFDISHIKEGRYIDESSLVRIILEMQAAHFSNINLVTPTQYTPQLINAIDKAKSYGLKIPVVYNCGGYEKVNTLKLWEGLVDIYMPDLKFFSPEKSALYANAEDYFERASKAILEMQRQTGDLEIKNGTATKGLLIRHLVLPNNQSDTKEIIDFVAENLGTNTYLNLMDQYYPSYKASEYPKINGRVDKKEFEEYVQYAKDKGFKRPDYLFAL